MLTKQYQINLNEAEKLLFEEWLQSREEGLVAQLQLIKSLRSKLDGNKELEPVKEEVRSKPEYKPSPVDYGISKPSNTHIAPKAITRKASKTNQLSWTNKIVSVFKLLNKSLISKELIDWFVINDETVKHKSRAFVSKSITAKLAILEEKAILKKELIDKKYVYTLNSVPTDQGSENLISK